MYIQISIIKFDLPIQVGPLYNQDYNLTHLYPRQRHLVSLYS